MVDCGRRFGKSTLGLMFLLQELVKRFEINKTKKRGWVVAPTFPLVRENWQMAEEIWKEIITNRNKAEWSLSLLDDIFQIDFKSAEKGDEGLRGAGLDSVLCDEASRMTERAWLYGLRPSLADKQGTAMFISTPKGQNWFYRLFARGQEEMNKAEIKSWKFTSKDNPFFPLEEWMLAKKELPEDVFKQEFEAEFLQDEASVFKQIERCVTALYQTDFRCQPNYIYSVGVDLAKAHDFTVITVFDLINKRIVDFNRFNQISWSLQKQYICQMVKKFNNAPVIIDSTGVGEPIYEDLQRIGLNITPIHFTNEVKKQLIQKLILAIEQQLFTIPNIAQLVSELKSFTYKFTLEGRIQYTAPEGLFDDCVISLALAIWPVDLYTNYKPRKDFYRSNREWEGNWKMNDYKNDPILAG